MEYARDDSDDVYREEVKTSGSNLLIPTLLHVITTVNDDVLHLVLLGSAFPFPTVY